MAPLSTAARTVSRLPDGSWRRISTAFGPLASTASTVLNTALPVLAIAPQRLSEATTSADVSALPLWNLTSLRSRIVYRLPPSPTSWPSASSGTGWYLASSAYRPSNMLMAISRVMTAVVVCTSSVGGSPIMPTRSTPPFRGLCDSPGATASQADDATTVAATTIQDSLARSMPV